MPLQNKEIHEVLALELQAMKYPPSMYHFTKQKNELHILAGDQRYAFKIKGLGFHAVQSLTNKLHDINEKRKKTAKSTQIDIEEVIGARQ
jgi:hypothetical protein